MGPFSLTALASAAGFVFKKMSGGDSRRKKEKLNRILPRRSKTVPGQLLRPSAGIDIDEIEELPEYTFIKKLVDAEFPIIFVTGGAGTGKSTFINWLMHYYSDNALLAAPTTTAALNINGKTMHSLFQLPLQWITQSTIKKAPYRDDIRNAKILIIDEISMVNANLLDGVSAFLRKNRGVDKPFGGLPVVMVGDLFQLPPVVKPGLIPFFQRAYDGNTKFYCARSLTETEITYYGVELTRTFRQSDRLFVEILADIREGRNIENALELINSRCTITSTPPEGSVWLVPRRSEVEGVNRIKLRQIMKQRHIFEGIRKGDYWTKEDSLPAPQILAIKVGAQVMLTQNDPLKRWVNGTVGVVHSINGRDIRVKTSPYGKIVKVDMAKWINFNYRWNHSARKMEKNEIGSYQQYPLVLAWAITIHKSQGKTIEKVHLDLGRGAFAFGQTYVALSRCRDLSGLSLSRPLTKEDIKVDRDSQLFNDHLHDLMEKLPQEKMLAELSETI